ncbi:hypothetical protein LguiB_004969 [Lonicera macranthoides]
MPVAAEIFKREAKVGENPVVLEAPEGFLAEWWSLFYDTYKSRNQEASSEAESSVKDPVTMQNEVQNMQPSVPVPQINQQIPLSSDYETKLIMMGLPPPLPDYLLAANMYEERPNVPRVSRSSQGLDAGDNGAGISLGSSIPSGSTSHGVPRATDPSTEPLDAGKNDIISPVPLKVNEVRPAISFGMEHFALNSHLQTPSQHQQSQTSQAIAPSSLQGTTSNLSNQMPYMSDLRGKSCRGGCAEAKKPLDEIFGSYLSHNDGNIANAMSNSFTTLLQNSSASNRYENKGIPFKEVSSLHSTRSEVLCCHFSSDGKLLASSGHEKKIFIWNVDTFNCVSTGEGHSDIVTDVRFRPSSSFFASSSFDRTLQLWDSSRPTNSILRLLGHSEAVVSLDFHPRRSDILCSCDINNEIRLWNIKQSACTRVFKGANRQVRFQPRGGNLLAAASGNVISLIDVETNYIQHLLEGHVKDVRSLCWDTSGKYIGSVSEDSARIWSTISGGKCIYELHSFGNKFESCTFHPGYSLLLVLGCYQSLELWNPTENNKTMTVAAHNGLIAALADSPYKELIASASHDQLVKLWK